MDDHSDDETETTETTETGGATGRRREQGDPLPTRSGGYHGDTSGYPAAADTSPASPDYPGDSAGCPERSQTAADSGGYLSSSDGCELERKAPARDDPKGGWMPDDALAAAATSVHGHEPPLRDRQVNIRLDYRRYQLLERAAELYGTRPTTMARMLVNRGSAAVINAHRAEIEQIRELDWGAGE